MSVSAAAHWDVDRRQRWLHGEPPDEFVSFDPESGIWNIYGYDEIVQVLGRPETYSSYTGHLMPEQGEFADGNLVQMDPPRHTKLRKLVSYALTPKSITALRPKITEVVDELLDTWSGRDRVELFADLAHPLPTIIITELLGIPPADRKLFNEWVESIIRDPDEFSVNNADEPSENNKVAVERLQNLLQYLRQHVSDLKKHPKKGLLADLLEAEVDGERLTENEIVNFANLLLVAGHVTTRMLIGNTVLCLDTFRDARREVEADRSQLPQAMEESLRYLSPTAVLLRATTRTDRLGDKEIPSDQVLLLWLGAANRDNRNFDNPNGFDIKRKQKPHLALGRGVHFCLGAPLARIEAGIALDALFDRYPRHRTDPEDPPRFQQTPYLTGVGRLPLILQGPEAP